MPADARNTQKPLVYVSYAWGDETDAGMEREQIVDKLCEALEKYDGIIVGRARYYEAGGTEGTLQTDRKDEVG